METCTCASADRGTQHSVLGGGGGCRPRKDTVTSCLGFVISLTLGPTVSSSSTVTSTGSVVTVGGGVGTYSDAFYILVGAVVILAVISGMMLMTRRRVGPGVAPT